MNASAPSFSVVIPTCHRNEALALCLERLAPGRQACMQLMAGNESIMPPVLGTYEVIITDDGCETTAEALVSRRFPWAKWTAGPKRGPAANRNHGASLAQGGWIAFTDDDCIPDSGWLAAFAKCAGADAGAEVLEGRTYVDRPQRHFLESSPINENGGNLWSCNLAVQTEAFRKAGGFDEDFPFAAMEDMDLHLRLKKSGARIRFAREAGVMHPWVMPSDWLRNFRRHLKSQLIYGRKHPEFYQQKHWFRLLMLHARNNIRLLFSTLIHPDRQTLRCLPMYWKACAYEVYVFWRKPAPESINA